MSEVPEYVPMLIKGKTDDPTEGGCLVQIANWLADPTSWTDHDLCVHHQLVGPAILINDSVSDDNRRRLALLAPAMAGTKVHNRGEEIDLVMELAKWVADHPQPLPIANSNTTFTPLGDDGQTVKIKVTTSYPDGGDAAVDWLFALVEEANRLLGREHRLLTETEGTALRALMNQ